MKQYFNQQAERVQISTASPILICWRLLINLFSFAIYIEISLELFNVEEFQKDNRGQAFFTWRIIVITFLLLDILISFFIEYKSKNGIILQKAKKKAKYYLIHYFVFDSIVVVYLFVSTYLPLPFWVGFLVFFRIPSNIYSDEITEEYLIKYQFLLLCYRIIKLIVIMLYIFNFFACAFYAMGLYSISISEPTWLEYDNSDIGNIDEMHHLTQYIISYFWAVETLVSMGYGEITPMNQYEIIIGDIALVSCMFVCLYVISNILSLQNETSTILEESLISIKKFMIAKKVSNKLYNEVSIFISQFQSESEKRDMETENRLIGILPNQLKNNFFYEANYKTLQKIPWIYNNFSKQFLEKLSLFVYQKYMNGNSCITLMQDDDPHLYLIEKGKIAVLFNNIEIFQLRKGYFFGSYTFFMGQNQEYIQYKTKSIVILTYIAFSNFTEQLSKCKLDQEKFQFIKDQVMYDHNLKLIYEGCYICRLMTHTTQFCPEISVKNSIIQNYSLYHDHCEQSRIKKFKRTGIKGHFQIQKIVPKFQIEEHNSITIDKRQFSKLLFQWYPQSNFKQQNMLISKSLLLNESLQQNDLVVVVNQNSWRKPLQFSYNQYLIYWQLFMMFINLFFFIAIPQIIFFWNYYPEFSDHGVFKCLRIIIIVKIKQFQILFIIDFMLQFNISIYVNGVLVKNKFKIAKQYLFQNLIFDLIPILMLFYMSISDKYVIVYLLGLVKLIPFFRFQFNLSDKLKIYPQIRQIYIIVGMFLEILYINHFFGCMFYGAGVYMYTFHPNSKTWVNDESMNFGVVITQTTPLKYLYSTYWALDAIIRIGYGDILPLNDLEFIITDLTVIMALVIVAVNISLIENMRKNSKLQNYFIDNLRIQQYLKSKKCSKELQNDISNYLRYYHRVGQDRNIEIEQQALMLLPQNLKHQIMYEAYRDILYKQTWFGNQEIVFQLSNKVQEVYLGDNENIFLDNVVDLSCSLYYIDRGFAELFINTQYSEKKEVIIAQLKQGAFFGHYSFITGLSRKASARTVKFASLIFITTHSLHDVIQANLQYAKQFQQLKDSIIYGNQLHQIGLYCYTCNAPDHFSIDCPLTSIKNQVKIQFQSTLREKSNTLMSLGKLFKGSKVQERRFRLRFKKRTKFIYIQKFQKEFNYVPPQGAINLIIDKI